MKPSARPVRLGVLAALALCPNTGTARVPLHEGDTSTLTLGGYVRTVTAWTRAAHAPTPTLTWLELDDPVEVGSHAAIGRLELRLAVADVTADVHSRLQWSQGASGLVGAGVTPTPDRSLDTETALTETDDGATLTHDLDRASVRLFLGEIDLSLGRQAIAWGHSTLFLVGDVWAPFSPFELDAGQRRGVDGARAILGLGDRWELDLLVADRGRAEDVSGGVRATAYLDAGDVFVSGGKSFEDVFVGAGGTLSLDTLTPRGEVLAAWDTDDDAVQRPKVTLGVDWFESSDLMLGAEAHYNGPGRDLEAVSRGETFLVETWYAGGLVAWKPYELATLSLTAMTNVTDPSVLLAWSAAYEMATDVELGLGGFHGVGAAGEFGGYPHAAFLQLAAYL